MLNIKKGFSLLEMLIYIAILMLMLGVIINIVISMTQSYRVIKVAKSVENSATISLERISREVRKADSIDTVSSIFDANPGKLVLNGEDSNGNPRTVEFYVLSDTIYLKENGTNLGPLSQPDARVKNLVFRLFSHSAFYGVRTEITIESGTSTYYRSDNFFSSATLR